MNQKYLNAISLEKTKRRKGIEGRQTGACEGRKGQNTWKLCLKKKKKKKRKKRYFLKCGFSYHES